MIGTPPPFAFLRYHNSVVPTDGPGPYKVPTTGNQFYQLGITPPRSLYLMQETSGDLVDSFGAQNLTAGGAPTYANAVAGWTRKAVATTQLANQGFTSVAGSSPNIATTSAAFAVYFKLTGAPGGVRDLMGVSGANGCKVSVTAAGLIRATCKGVSVDGVINHNDGNVHMLLMVYNRTAATFVVRTNLETITGTYNSATSNNVKGYGAVGLSSAPADYLWGFVAAGGVAEGYGAATLTALGW